ncbi:TRAP transporter small permease [Microbaculum marinum]|uniref:TRAP transporter small permease protein n=1 Tax=Microbaculum marinum TaxID=1764581 RepID=A0AAW9RV04_9HYPH
MTDKAASPHRFKVTSGLVAVCGGAAGVFLFILMMLTVVDVVGRYFLNAPLPGGFELTEFIMAAIVYAGLPVVSAAGAHITIDLLDDVTPARVVPWQSLMVNVACAGCFGVFAWRLWLLGNQISEYGDVTEYLGIPQSPVIYLGAATSAVAAIIHLSKLFEAGRQIVGAGKPGAGL